MSTSAVGCTNTPVQQCNVINHAEPEENYYSVLPIVFKFLDVQSLGRSMLTCKWFKLIGSQLLQSTHAKALTRFKIEKFFKNLQKSSVWEKQITDLEPGECFTIESLHPLKEVCLLRGGFEAFNRTNAFHLLTSSSDSHLEAGRIHESSRTFQAISHTPSNATTSQFHQFKDNYSGTPNYLCLDAPSIHRPFRTLEKYLRRGDGILDMHSISTDQIVSVTVEGNFKKYQISKDGQYLLEVASQRLVGFNDKKTSFIGTCSWLIGTHLFITLITKTAKNPIQKLQCYNADTRDLLDEKEIPNIHCGLRAISGEMLILCSSYREDKAELNFYRYKNGITQGRLSIPVNKQIDTLVANDDWIVIKSESHFVIYKNDGSLWWEFNSPPLCEYTGVHLVNDLMLYARNKKIYITHLGLREQFIFKNPLPKQTVYAPIILCANNMVHLDLGRKALFFKTTESTKRFFGSENIQSHLYRLTPISTASLLGDFAKHVILLPPLSQSPIPTLTFWQKINQAVKYIFITISQFFVCLYVSCLKIFY